MHIGLVVDASLPADRHGGRRVAGDAQGGSAEAWRILRLAGTRLGSHDQNAAGGSGGC